MKNYFDFNLTGSKLFPFFIVFITWSISHSILEAIDSFTDDPTSSIKSWSNGVYVIYMIAILFMGFFIGKLVITAISYKNENLEFNGTYSEYLKINFTGIILSIITLGIYYCWYDKKLMDYIARNTTHKGTNFKFNGRAIILFLIMTIALCLGIVASAELVLAIIGNAESNMIQEISLFCTMFLLLAPTSYFTYRWSINFSYGDNRLVTMEEGGVVRGCLFMLGQVVLSIITIGLYYPAAIIRITRYFANRVEVRNNEGILVYKMGCDAKMGEDYLLILGQFFLTTITAGIYSPWAICNIVKQLASKTHLEETAK